MSLNEEIDFQHTHHGFQPFAFIVKMMKFFIVEIEVHNN
jgi:hypothetical protein